MFVRHGHQVSLVYVLTVDQAIDLRLLLGNFCDERRYSVAVDIASVEDIICCG